MSSLNGFQSPLRPIPQFFNETNTFTTKKARYNSTPCPKKIPPRPPSKSVPPISRLFRRPNHQSAQAISFKDNSDTSLSKHYDSTREESYFEQCFEIEAKIGSGSFGDVFKVKSKEDGKFYAIKKSRERFKGKSDRERKLEEVCKHEQLPKHPNCVRLYKAWEERQHLYIQTELCQISLSEFAERNHDIPEYLVCNYLVDLLKAVRHLHDHNLIHLDIKPENIFISSDGICKLGDFGLVLDVSKNNANEATEGDPKYLAKELMQGQFTKAADIFSLGITILEIACDLDLPSGGEGWHRLRDGQIPDQLFTGISRDLRDLIKDMMHPDFKLRPSAKQLLNRPFIRQIESSRRWKLRAKRSVKLAKTLINWFVKTFILICYPFKYLYKKLTKSPNNETSKAINLYKPEFDSNYSDDESCDNSFLNDTDSTAISSQSGQRLSSATPNDPFDIVNSVRKFCSTSLIHRHRPLFETPLPSPSFTPSSPIQRLYDSNLPESPTIFKEANNRSKNIISQKLNFDEQSDEDSLEWDKSYNIGPKNLLDTFDQIENDGNDSSD